MFGPWPVKQLLNTQKHMGAIVFIFKLPTPLYLLLASKSEMHLLICAIHSDFSVAVAAYTVNDLVVLIICQPFFKSKKELHKKHSNQIILLTFRGVRYL